MANDAFLKLDAILGPSLRARIDGDLAALAPLVASLTDRQSQRLVHQWAYEFLAPAIASDSSVMAQLAVEEYDAQRLEVVGRGYSAVPFTPEFDIDALTGWAMKDAADMQSLGQALWQAGMYRVRNGYMQTIMGNTGRDPRSAGWIRIAEPGACPFCLMLASRAVGWHLYRSQASASFMPHNACRCHAAPSWNVGESVRVASVNGKAPGKKAWAGQDADRQSQWDAYAERVTEWGRANGMTDRSVA